MTNQSSDKEYGEALARLQSNPDYKLVIAEGYIGQTSNLVTDLIQGEEDVSLRKLKSIADLKEYLGGILTTFDVAEEEE